MFIISYKWLYIYVCVCVHVCVCECVCDKNKWINQHNRFNGNISFSIDRTVNKKRNITFKPW